LTTKPPTQTTAPATTAGPQQYGGVLTYSPSVSPGGPIGWPSENIGTVDGLQQFALEPLVKVTVDGTLIPWLATSWNVAQDGSLITFNLRKGVKFSDGTDFNAQAVKFNFDFDITNKASAAVYWKSVDVVDDYTVRINLSQFTNVIWDGICSGNGFIVSPTAYQKNGVDWMRQNMVGTGPFLLTKYTRDVSAEFKRNPNYWQTGKPYLDGVKVVWFADRLTASAAIQVGDIDAMQLETGSLAASLLAKKFAVTPVTTGMIGLIFDGANADSPFHDKRVCQAVDYAIDKEAIVKAKGYGFWNAAYQWAPYGTALYDPNYPAGRHYDPDKAKQLLTAAGYPNGFSYKFIVSPQGTDPDEAVAIQNFLGKVGINVSIETPVYAKYLEYRNVSTWSGAFLMQPLGMQYNMNIFLNNYITSKGGLLKSMYRPADIDQMVADSLKTITPDNAKIKAIFDYAYDQAMLIPTHDTGQTFVFNQNRIHDAGFLTLGNPSHWQPWNAWISK
jgi:peptide/nickel transport system substrate-binding protein